MKKIKLVIVIFTLTLSLVGANLVFLLLDENSGKKENRGTDILHDVPINRSTTVDKLNSQVSVKKLRELVLETDVEVIEEQSRNKESENYDLREIQEEILVLEQRLNREL